ncbi:MAG: multicopper oxidase, partial [Myxococcaceae bacterium]|nr:multicopper oxidase [Myxococcaceae bacterium]
AELKLAALEDLDPSDAVVEHRLEAKVQNLELRPGKQTPMWTYNGTVPGPLIRAKKGQRLKLHFTNSLPAGTSIHWHGMRVPNQMDGAGPTIPAGGTFDYEFDLIDAGTFWYHSHVDSSAQVGFGLFGALVVEDPAEQGLGDDVVLMFTDLGVKPDGTLRPGDESGWFGDYFGREGELLLVNGKQLPTLKARQGVPQRWRVINASRARYLKFKVLDQSLVRIGGDSGLIARPQPISDLTLTPGERAELYVNPKGPAWKTTIFWEDSDRFHINSPRPPEPFMVFEVTADGPPARAATPLPAKLRTVLPIDTTAAKAVSLELMEKVGPTGNAVLGFNGSTFDEAAALHAVVGETELWSVSNSTAYDHPFHLHGFSFQVREDNQVPWPVLEWKDTVNIPAKHTVKLAVTWDDRPGMWMFHCHILDHVELGMMGSVMLMRP